MFATAEPAFFRHAVVRSSASNGASGAPRRRTELRHARQSGPGAKWVVCWAPASTVEAGRLRARAPGTRTVLYKTTCAATRCATQRRRRRCVPAAPLHQRHRHWHWQHAQPQSPRAAGAERWHEAVDITLQGRASALPGCARRTPHRPRRRTGRAGARPAWAGVRCRRSGPPPVTGRGHCRANCAAPTRLTRAAAAPAQPAAQVPARRATAAAAPAARRNGLAAPPRCRCR